MQLRAGDLEVKLLLFAIQKTTSFEKMLAQRFSNSSYLESVRLADTNVNASSSFNSVSQSVSQSPSICSIASEGDLGTMMVYDLFPSLLQLMPSKPPPVQQSEEEEVRWGCNLHCCTCTCMWWAMASCNTVLCF